MIQSVLIVCVGNICRSPIGEALFAERLKQRCPNVVVSSAGVAAMVNYPADSVAQELMQARGLDISGHRARQISSDILFSSELILTMTTDQQVDIESKYPGTRGRVHRLGKWGEYDIPDPFKRPRIVFDQCLAMIDQGVDDWIMKFWGAACSV